MQARTDNYQFAAEPKVVSKSRRFRDSGEAMASGRNIMYDHRVVRGNTYAAMVIPASHQQDQIRMQKEERRRKRRMQEEMEASREQMRREVSTPEPIEGRVHIDIQTDNFLEELTDKAPEYEIEVQTDFFIDRPTTPLFMPVKTGIDKDTQIEDGELFDYDEEVEPILQVLTNKILEQSRMEVLEEEELSAMRKHQREFEQLREAELMETQRLEAAELRRADEIERRKLQHNQRQLKNVDAHKKIISRLISKSYLSKLKVNTVQLLQDQGFFRDSFVMGVHDQFVPWLYQEIVSNLGDETNYSEFVEKALAEAVESLAQQHGAAVKAEMDRREFERKEKERLAYEKEQARLARIAERARLREEKRRQELRQTIEDKLISSGVSRDVIVVHPVSDMAGYFREAEIVGSLAGAIGEIILVLNYIKDYIKKHHDPKSETPETELSAEKITEVLREFLGKHYKAPTLEVLLPAAIAELLEKYALSLEDKTTFQNLTDEQWMEFCTEIIAAENLGSQSLQLLRAHAEDLSIDEGIFNNVILAFFTLLRMKDDQGADLIGIRQKLGLTTAPEKTEADIEKAVVRIRIPMEPKEEEPQTGEDTARKSDVQDTERQETEVEHEEVEIEDRVLAIKAKSPEGVTIFVLHQAATRRLRQALLHYLQESIPECKEIDPDEDITELEEKLGSIENKVCNLIEDNIPIFDFPIN
eukprot:CAMPEP_0115034536 /NCGR_PEP_ID=MMETSP0216-20121206/40720_1 /TAXON_ID=223996 /ORGANISM="Protocruzia adherens, Strain Boccale" /LENGTH=700 /DNA_ID=CAMNT_0002413461 /DNA_START=34 /DNA_END=2136 /DNA_ORIENTATION=+